MKDKLVTLTASALDDSRLAWFIAGAVVGLAGGGALFFLWEYPL